MSTTALPLARGGRTGTTLAPPRQRPQWHDPRSRALSPPMPLQTTELTGIAERRAAQSPQPPPPVPPLIQPVSATGTTTSAHAVLDRVASILDRFKESSENGNDAAMIQSQAASSLARRASIALAHAMLDHLDLTQTAATMVHETGIDLARSASTHRALRAALDRATYDRAADVLRTAASTAIPPVTPETVRPALDLCQYLGVLHAHAALGGAAALAAVEFVRAARMRAALRERIHRGPAPSVSLAPAVVADLWCAVAALAMGSAAPAGKPVPAMPYGLDPWAVAAAPAVAALAWDWDATVLAVPPPHAWMSALGAVSDARQELVVSGYYEGRLTDEPRAVIPVATLAPPRLRGGTVQEPSPDGSPTGSRASTPRASEKNSRLQQQRLGGAVELAHTHSQNQQHHGRTLRSHQQASSSTASTTTLPALPAAATRRKDSAVSLGSDAMSMTSFASSVGTGASASSLAARHAHELGSSGSAHQQQHQQLQARPTRLHHARTAVPPVLPSPGSSVTSQPWLSAKSPVRSAGGTPHDRSRGSVSQPQARSPQLPQAPSRPPPAKTGRRRVPPPPPGPRSAISPQNNHFSALEHDQQQQQSSPQRTDLPEVPVPPAVPWPRPSHAAGVDATVISPATIEDVYGPFYGVVKFMDVTMYQGSPLIAFYCDPAPDRRLIVYHAHPPNNGSTGGGRVLARIALTKPLTALSFLTPSSPTYSVHGGDSSDSPEHAQWLVGADTDADVHAWHWPTRTRRTWRKWHRRVVHMVTGFPGRRDDVGGGWGARGGIVARNNPGAVLVSCSADHSVRVWGVRSAPGELSVEDAGRWAPEDSAMASVGGRVAGAGAPASVHSNAPFLAICFSGCSTDVRLVCGAAYWDGRTLTHK
ncbi:hypothetical protein BC828DRAFT_45919 [Blastocladiella britannica]|nr:hypothetical protein BC828DRAFT_45919 [Blastocladiella britannica]